jgi:Calcineurin-like phosphoesterase
VRGSIGALGLLALSACGDKTAATSASPERTTTPVSLSDRTALPAKERVVAIGDLHGDLGSTRRALKLAGAIDDHDAWIGGKLVVVQTGDEIDRGDDDRQILDLIEKLKAEAKSAGGELIALNGNHELMNASFDFRYVTDGGFAAFADVEPANDRARTMIERLSLKERGRAAAFAPGGPYATKLADRPVVVKIGDDVFVHGGIAKKHVDYGIDRLNDETRDFLLGKRSTAPDAVVAEDGVTWLRWYSQAPSSTECASLNEALAALGAKRMIMGHTVQRDGINPACDGKAWRIDVGLSSYYHGPIQVLEISSAGPKVLKE